MESTFLFATLKFSLYALKAIAEILQFFVSDTTRNLETILQIAKQLLAKQLLLEVLFICLSVTLMSRC